MERFIVLQYIDYENNTTTKNLYAVGLKSCELIKKICDDIRNRQTAGEKITLNPSMILIKTKYYYSTKVETKNSIEHYYIVPFETVSIREYI